MGKKNFIYVKDNGHISIEALACKMASYIFAEGALGTQYGGWSMSTSELEDYFSLEEGTIDSDFVEKITDAIQNNFGDMVEIEEAYEDEDEGVVFDLTYYHSFVPGFLEDDCCIIENREDILEEDEVNHLIEETSFEDLARIFSKYCGWLKPISEFHSWLEELESRGTHALMRYAIECQKYFNINIIEDNLGEKYKYFEKLDTPMLYNENTNLKEVIFRFFGEDLHNEVFQKFIFDLFYNLYGEEK